MFSRFIIDKDGRAGRDLLVCASKPSRPRREGQRPVPYIAIPVYSGSKMFVQINYRSFFCLLFFSKKSAVVFLYVLSFLKRKYERKQFGEDPETPLKGQGGAYLPSQRHRCERQKSGSNVRLFLIVRGFCACGDGIKQEFFCLIFQNTNKKERETRSFDESIKFAQNNYRSFFHLLSFQA